VRGGVQNRGKGGSTVARDWKCEEIMIQLRKCCRMSRVEGHRCSHSNCIIGHALLACSPGTWSVPSPAMFSLT